VDNFSPSGWKSGFLAKSDFLFLHRLKRPKASHILACLAALMFFFLTAPLLAMVWRAFGDLSGAKALFGRSVVSAISLSLGTTAVSVLLILFLGTPLAYVLARYHFRFKRLVNVLIELPIILPPVVAGFGLLMAFGRRGLFGPLLEQVGLSLPFTTTAVIVAQTFVAAPFFIRTAQVRFSAIPRDLMEAASIDGASTGTIFRYIALPLSTPGLLAGLVLSWARALGEFGATILFAGSLQGRTQTMPLLVYGALERNLNDALWSSLLLIILALLALLVVRWLTRRLEIDPMIEA
jgi:molybdate transport system permease protein